MKGSEARLIEFMEGSKKRFIIPVYQRNYDWKTENCKQLYDDLIKVIKYNRKNHFFGSVVSVFNPDGRHSEYLVIDGQQRLTTVSLLLLAMYNLLDRRIITPSTETLAQQIYEDFLVDKFQPSEKRIKLKPVKNDQIAFVKLFEDDSEHIKDSNLTINYKYFYDRIQKAEITIDELYDAIFALEIIDIKLNGDDNPQLIFESLNSTGLALSEGDKIRNLILMGLTPNMQEEYYEKYWNKIEQCTNYDVSSFVRDYLSVKQLSTPSMSKIYITFKYYLEESGMEVLELLVDLLNYAKLYKILLSGKTSNRKLNSCIYRLNRLETTITRPFFLEVLRLNDNGILKEDEVEKVFYITENYLFRRTICDLPTNVLNKIFLTLHKDIVKYDGTTDDYINKLSYTLLAKKDRARFPDDNEFAEAIEEKPIYLMNSKNKVYLLERFENFGTIEDKNVWEHIENGDYTIEHIMPQHLTPTWVKGLGSDYEIIHETWIHRMANLTLTAYNSKYSNSPFEEKRDMKNGFKESGIRMNQMISQNESFGLIELEKRSEYMKNKALKIWELPNTTFKPAEKELDNITLDDEVSLSGRQIIKFSYKKIEQPVTSWVDMYQRVLQLLHSEDKSVLTKLAAETDENVDLAVHITDTVVDHSKYVEIDDGIYLWKQTSTDYKVSLLKRFFKLFDAEATDLVFYLKDNDEDEEVEEATRHKLRKKYWSYALEHIHKEFGEESFNNVNPSKSSFISGYFGYGGFNITCVVNYDSVRTELQLGNGKKEINKKAYDYLYTKKDEIEGKLNAKLEWNRNDDLKGSKICIGMEEVGLSNEGDWERMANFHASWSRRFYDVFIPYLKDIRHKIYGGV